MIDEVSMAFIGASGGVAVLAGHPRTLRALRDLLQPLRPMDEVCLVGYDFRRSIKGLREI